MNFSSDKNEDNTKPPVALVSREEPRLLTRPSVNVPQAQSPPTLTSRQKRYVFIALGILFGLSVTVIVAVIITSVFLRRDMRASLPQIDGTLQVSGLAAPVIVARDGHGMPSIQAQTLDDLLFAQGFVTAQDRLWQMDALRRHAAGELAELLGSSLVEHDRMQRTLQLRATADRAITTLPADQLHQLEAYARGVNAFITQASGPGGDHLAVEFHLLHYKPAPWTPRDSMLVSLAMYQDLSTEFPTKLSRESLSAHLPPQLLADLYPVGSWRDHPPGGPGPDLTLPHDDVQQVPLDGSQAQLQQPTATPRDLLAAAALLPHKDCEGCRSGSNNWAVAGSRSASGKPLVSNDMHLNLSVPDIWYTASLHTVEGALDVAGVTLPGVPFVIVGRNAHVAWGFTSLSGDVQDIAIEHLRGSGDSTEFQRSDGTWSLAQHQHEIIRVRGGHDVSFDILLTTHNIGAGVIPTPIISALYHSEKRSLALLWTAYDAPSLSVPFFAVDTAASGASLAAAFSTFAGPSLNLIYGDDQDHIGYHAIGHIPIRGAAVQHPVIPADTTLPAGTLPPEDEEEQAATVTDVPAPRHAVPAEPAMPKSAPRLDYTIGSPIPLVPFDALDANAQWSGYVPYDALPSVVDPPNGFLATANARITPNGYPYALANDWFSPYRTERIYHLLADRTGLTPADLLHVEMDIHSEFDRALAQRFAYAIDHDSKRFADRDPKRLREAADLLRSWNGDVYANASAANIVSAARTALWPMLLVPQIAEHDRDTRSAHDPPALDIAALYSWGEQTFAMEQIVQHQSARWLPREYANWNDFLTEAVERGLTQQHAPLNLQHWGYGPTHPVTLDHLLLSSTPVIAKMLGVTVGSGPRTVDGDGSTVKQTTRRFGPSERFTADLNDPSATIGNITTGESGNPDSPWYLDQLPLWLAGRSLPLPLTPASDAHTLTLKP